MNNTGILRELFQKSKRGNVISVDFFIYLKRSKPGKVIFVDVFRKIESSYVLFKRKS